MNRSEPHIFQKKSLSQVFLRENWPCQKIVQKLQQWQVKRVLEIGPGAGILTHELLQAGFAVTSVEKDSRFFERLNEIKTVMSDSERERFQIVNQDFLKFDLDSWCKSSERSALVGNIPYSISSQILLSTLQNISLLVGAMYLVQLEFGQRLVAAPNTKIYGSLSVYTQLRAKATLEGKVAKTCFKPIPAVDSVLVSLQYRANNIEQRILKHAELITRAAFMQRRKKMINSIAQYIKGLPAEELGVDLNRRGESLSPEEFTNLAAQVLRLENAKKTN
ncbi:MAG: ribosomal RNA small subunit methyltransferase A [Oligoflexales bacterium]|nr:ribosomal RNA small subunit methyltransferase A [Oligoflexales bacterium]